MRNIENVICIDYFSIVVIKHRDQDNLQMSLRFQGVRVYDDGARTNMAAGPAGSSRHNHKRRQRVHWQWEMEGGS